MKCSAIGIVIGVCLMMVTLSYGQDCVDAMCQRYCEYGFKQDNKGCDICECNAQTDIREGQCPQIAADAEGICSEACAHDGLCASDQKCCFNGCGHMCTAVVRDGFCPDSATLGAGSVGTCAEMCTTDSECTDNSTLKCCLNSCGGHTCAPPDTEKRGSCPIGLLAEGSLGVCSELCDQDADCPALQKCCSNGCGHVCITPIDLPEVHPGSCPAAPAGGSSGSAGSCANTCMNDVKCKDTEKCCQNECGGYVCTTAVDVPVKCADVICLRWCPHDFKQDDNGCDICECAEETEIHDGECPVSNDQMGACSEACEHDGDCEDNQKCCSNACGHTCVQAITPDPEGCPINTYSGQLGTCDEDCTANSCNSGELCCSNGCGHACTKPVTVHDGECPTGNLTLGSSGVCVEMCNYDGQCASNQKCCSNGCGHVCIDVEMPPESCPEVVCQIFCEYGNKEDNNGCISCECQEPSDAGVERPGECPVGFLPEGISGTCAEECSSDDNCTDTKQKCCSNGCGHECIDALNTEPECPPILCTRYCENGLQKDDKGCDVCACNEKQECGNVMCLRHCSYGYKEDEYGCNICDCKDKPSKCPAVKCQMFCLYGYERDAEGCEICQCTPKTSALSVTEGSCPEPDNDSGSCSDLCDIDSECSAGEKCCYNGCGHVCTSADGSGATVLASPIMLLALTLVSIFATWKL